MAPDTAAGARAWWGRVFARGTAGGSYTVVVLPGHAIESPADIAAALAVPDTGFVTAAADGRVSVRTFSPVEEVSQCFQVALAAVMALGAPEGAPWSVHHERAPDEELTVVREGSTAWARHAVAREPRVEAIDWPDLVAAEPAGEAVVLRHARSRIHLRCARPEQLDAIALDADDVVRVCAETETYGVVLSADAGNGLQRVRVFTTSQSGREDNGTGGAVMGVGQLAALDGARGELRVVQGPAESSRQGHMVLRISGDRGVELGGEVMTLQVGRLLIDPRR